MFHRLRDKVNRARYDRKCRGILETPPLAIMPAPLIFCSMVSQRDLIMYLVAIKSLYRNIGEGTIYIINDGSLTATEMDLLNHHLGSPTIEHIKNIPTDPCPRGGTWERLLRLVTLAEQAYVMQVDSDLLARQPVPEVVQCYRENWSFTLGTGMGQSFTTLKDAASTAKVAGGTHIQIVAEQAFDRLDGAAEKRYVRGCSGFTGFAHGLSLRPHAEEFSMSMQRRLGDRWQEWGTEQVTSNYLIANSARSCVLPATKYVNFSPQICIKDAALLHFIGTHRFYHGIYATLGAQVVAEVG